MKMCSFRLGSACFLPYSQILDILRPLGAILRHGLHQFFAQQIQIGQAKQGLQLCNVLDQAPKPGFAVAKMGPSSFRVEFDCENPS